MKKTWLFIFLFNIIYFSFANHHSFKPMLDSAFKAYQKGNYEQCIQYYQKIEQQGFTSSYMYYNMGNAFFRSNQIAKAILYYERALRLNPSDLDIQHNLKFANTFVTDKITELPKPFYISWFNSLINLFSANSWAWISLISFLMLLVFVYINFLTSIDWLLKTLKISIFLLIIIFSVSTISAYASYHKQVSQNEAIVMADAIEVKSSPDEKGTTLFVIHEGTKINITDEFENWVEIRLADGNTGWIKQSHIEII